MAKENEKIAREARIAYEKFQEPFKVNIDNYHLMHSFILGRQWDQEEEDDMIKTYRKVALTANKLATMSNALIGEQQQNTPQLQVVPMVNCDEKVASLREIITKDIVFSPDATIAYQVSAGQAAIGGYGAYGIGTDYEHEKSLNQKIVHFHFKDSTRAFWDLSAEKKNKTDGMHCGFISCMSRKNFRQKYGKDVEQNILKSSSITQTQEEIALAVQPDESTNPFNWADDEHITIIDYYVREYEKDRLYGLSNGETLNQEEMDELIKSSKAINDRNRLVDREMLGGDLNSAMAMDGQLNLVDEEPLNLPLDGIGVAGSHEILPQPKGMDLNKFKANEVVIEEEPEVITLWRNNEIVRIVNQRPKDRYKIIHYRIAGNYELDKTVFPSQSLPIIFVDNNSYYDKTGKQICRSFFQDCRDTQRYINYLRTQSAYVLKVSRYDQWFGPKTVVSSLDTRRNWADPTNTQGLLAYDKDPDGLKPEQIRPPELSQSLETQYNLAMQDLYTSTGLYPARMGNNGDEASGKALDARTRQGSFVTYGFFNSINMAIEAGGEVINEMIPNVYDTERVMTLMMPDKGFQNITINKETDPYGEQIENDIRKGTYQVRLKPGPSYEGQKEQALQSLREVLQADPTAFNLIADLYAENLPLANTIEIKNRLKTRVPPQIIEAGKTGEMPQQQGPSPEQEALAVDAQFKQQQIQIKQQELALKQQQMQAEIEIEQMKLEIAKLELAGNIEEQRMRYMAETERTQSDNAIAHADNMVKILTHNTGDASNVRQHK